MTRQALPMWKQVFDAVDKRLSPTVNELAKRDDVASLIGLGLRGRAEVERTFERLSRRSLHLLNLPAGSDVNRLLEHIARVEREVRDLRHQLADRENADFLAALEANHAVAPRRPSSSARSTGAPTRARKQAAR